MNTLKNRIPPSWNPSWRRQDFNKPIDFFARRIHFIDHLAPMWNFIDKEMRGNFYVPKDLVEYTNSLGIDAAYGLPPITQYGSLINIVPNGHGPIVTCAYGDMSQAYRQNTTRPQILMEHGVGLSFPEHSHGYAGGGGIRQIVSLFLPPNEVIRAKTAKTFPGARQVVIGTPKMDKWVNIPKKKKDTPPTVAIAFHWDGSKAVCPEAGNAYNHYKDHIHLLKKHFTILGHGHPKIIEKLRPDYQAMGIEVVTNFEDVLARADIYVNDSSSTLYEFSCTDRPVVILNAPWFRKNVNFGIRWWDYTDIGPQCDNPADLVNKIKESLADKTKYAPCRRKAVEELYPYLGQSAIRGAKAIMELVLHIQNGGQIK